jgi:uncharacterized repeat protein (TIGR01451 family)
MGFLKDVRSRKGSGWLSGWFSLVIIVVLGVLALALLRSGSRVWATEGQSRLYQTVPTATFTPESEDTATPTEEPAQPTSTPTRTKEPKPPTATPKPLPEELTPTPVPTATPSPMPTVAVPELVLAQTSSSEMVEPGAELTFTLQLTNPGPQGLQDVLIEDILPDALLLLDVAAYGGEPEVSGNRFSVLLDRLAPGLPVIITVRAQVASDTAAGAVIDHQPTVTVAGLEQRWPLLSVGLPPTQLPPTGDSCPQL